MKEEMVVETKTGLTILDPTSIVAMLEVNEDGFIRVNEVAEAAGKLATDWVRLARTQELIRQYQELNTVMGIPIMVQQGGTVQGTWVHKDLGHSFLMWCFPKYELWVNKILNNLFRGTVPNSNFKPAPVSKTTAASLEWKEICNAQASICDLLNYSPEFKRRVFVEVGKRLEASQGVLIVPTEMQRPLLLGTEAPTDEGVAVVAFGGKQETVTCIGQRFGVKGEVVNKALISLGYQNKILVGDYTYYVPTPISEQWCTIQERTMRISKKKYTKIEGWKLEFIYLPLEKYFKSYKHLESSRKTK